MLFQLKWYDTKFLNNQKKIKINKKMIIKYGICIVVTLEKCISDKLIKFFFYKKVPVVQVPFYEEKIVQIVRIAFFRSDF